MGTGRTTWIRALSPTLWTLLHLLRELASPSDAIPGWGVAVTTEAALAAALGFGTPKPVRRALASPLAPLLIRVRHRAVRAGRVPVRLPSEYWVLLQDPPQSSIEQISSGKHPDAVLLDLGIPIPPAGPPGYRRSRARPSRSRQLPMVTVIDTGPAGEAPAAAVAGRPAEILPTGTFPASGPSGAVGNRDGSVSTGGPEMGLPGRGAEKNPTGTLPTRRKRTQRGADVVFLQNVQSVQKEQQHIPPRRELFRALVGAGVSEQVAAMLLAEPGGPERAARQLAWLPHRQVRDPAAALVTAIREDWPPPAGMPQNDPPGGEGTVRPLERLKALRRSMEEQVALAETAMRWLASQPEEVRARLEAEARALLESEAPGAPVPRAAVRAVLVGLALERMGST